MGEEEQVNATRVMEQHGRGGTAGRRLWEIQQGRNVGGKEGLPGMVYFINYHVRAQEER